MIGHSPPPPVATGAEVNTGTDDIKIVSAKALADSTYIKPNAIAITGTGGTTVLTAAQNKCTSLELDGALTSDWYIVIADTKAPFSVENLCTNTATYRVFIKTSAGTETPYVSPGAPQTFYSNGVNAELMGSTCNSGTQFPTSPAPLDATWFYRTDIATLFLYNAAAAVWKAMQSFGAVTIYVDGTSGSDIGGNGYASGASAVATYTYALGLVPPLNGGNVTISVASGTIVESPQIGGKVFSGDYQLIIQGTMSTVVAAQVADIATATTIGKSTATWTVNAYANKRVRITSGTGAGQIAIIESNTATTLTIAGAWAYSDGTNGGAGVTPTGATFIIEDWATILTTTAANTKIKAGQFGVLFKDIKLVGTVYVMPNSQVTYFGCWGNSNGSGTITNRNIYIENSNAFLFSSLISGVSAGSSGAIQAIDSSSVFIGGCHIYNMTNTAVACTASQVKIAGTTINTATIDGVYSERNGTVTFLGANVYIKNITGYGAKEYLGGVLINSTNPTYTSCTAGNVLLDQCLVSAAGTIRPTWHPTQGTGTLVAGVLTVTLTSPASYTSATSYTVSASGNSASTYKVTYTSGTAFTITSSNLADTHVVNWLTIGD